MGKVIVENIKVYAHHGCLKEETIIGSEYRVDVITTTSLKKAALSDHLEDTVDYVFINKVVKQEMAQPSKLLEHVAKRIIDCIFLEQPSVKRIKVLVSKINPPIGGDVEKVTIELKEKRRT